MYKRGDFIMQEIKTSCKFEVVAAIARRTGQRRKLATLAAYIPPSYTAEQNKECLEYINGLVASIKQKYNAPYILIAGDFNHRKISKELENFPDIKEVLTPPTRGNHKLDLVLTNFSDRIEKAGVMDPIFNASGQQTDHKTVYVKAQIPRVEEYTVNTYTYLRKSKEGHEAMKQKIRGKDWSELMESNTTTQMVEKLHGFFNESMNASYQKVTIKRNEPQWMTNAIRKLIARRRAIFREERRSDRWKKLKKKIMNIIKKRRKAYNEDKKSKMLSKGANFFTCVKSIVNNDNQQSWDPVAFIQTNRLRKCQSFMRISSTVSARNTSRPHSRQSLQATTVNCRQ